MSSPIADSVLAATHKLVQQAMTGQWQEVPRTVAERRVLLDKLSATAAPQVITKDWGLDIPPTSKEFLARAGVQLSDRAMYAG